MSLHDIQPCAYDWPGEPIHLGDQQWGGYLARVILHPDPQNYGWFKVFAMFPPTRGFLHVGDLRRAEEDPCDVWYRPENDFDGSMSGETMEQAVERVVVRFRSGRSE
jgi:hypothetical protein